MSSISRSKFKRQIRNLDPIEFEEFVADIWSKQGWSTRLTSEQWDRGIDIVATQDNPISEKHLIQAKRYSEDNPIGSPDVQQYASLRQQEQAVDAVVIVTSGRFSEQAERVARDLNVKLVDGDDLYDIIESHGLSSVLADYCSIHSSISKDQTSKSDTSNESFENKNTEHNSLGWPTVTTGFIALVFILMIGGAAAVGGGLIGSGDEDGISGDGVTSPSTEMVTGTPQQTANEAGTAPAMVGESVTQGQLTITVSNYTFAQRLDDAVVRNSSENSKFLLVVVSVENTGTVQQRPPRNFELFYYDEEIDMRPLAEESFYVRGKELDRYLSNTGYSELYPGDTVEGWVVFEVPKDFDSKNATVQIGYGDSLRWRLAE